MTNQPPFDQQMAINEYWKNVNGSGFFRFSPRRLKRDGAPAGTRARFIEPIHGTTQAGCGFFLCIQDPVLRWLRRNGATQGIWVMFGQWW
jgi:hypothetical protein